MYQLQNIKEEPYINDPDVKKSKLLYNSEISKVELNKIETRTEKY